MDSRYQNALLYAPGMAVGRHPEVSAATMARPTVGTYAPTAAPMQFSPYVSAMGSFGAASPTFASFDAPTDAASSAGPTNALSGAAGAAGLGLGSLAVKGAIKAADYLSKPSTQDALDVIPQVQYGGSASGLVPAADNPFNTDIFYAPNGLDLGVGDAGFYGNGGFAPGTGPQATTAADIAAAYDVPTAGSGSWTGGYDASGAPIFTEGGVDGASDGLSSLSGGFDFTGSGINMAASALGTYGGTRLAKSLVRGDQQDQRTASSIGGTIGGTIGTLILPGVGTLIGSFLGSLGGGTLAAGEPDDPYSFASGNITGGANGPSLYFGGGGAMNGGDPNAGNAMGSRLTDYINGRAAQDGYQINPEMINQGVGSIGYKGGPDGGYFYSDPGHAPGEDQHAWTGGTFNDLGNSLYGTLLGGGFLSRPGTTADWNTVQQDLANTALGADPGYAPIYSGSPMGQYNATWQGVLGTNDPATGGN